MTKRAWGGEWARTIRHIFTCAAVVITAWQAPIVPLGIALALTYYLLKVREE
jgi:hypothetical protein